MTALEFKNELIRRLNENLKRYYGGIPDTELFAVDDVYEVIDRVYDGIPEDNGEIN